MVTATVLLLNMLMGMVIVVFVMITTMPLLLMMTMDKAVLTKRWRQQCP
jgi:hypothetical protein